MEALGVNNLCKTYDGVSVLRDISFSLSEGEILGIWGGNASAKTTLVNLISGIRQPDSGSISVFGRTCNMKNTVISKNMGISVIREEIQLFENMSAAENIYIGSYRSIPGIGSAARFGLVDKRKVEKEAGELFARFHFPINAHTKVKNLGRAEQQIVFIFHALVQNAKILIMDEPFNNLDQKETEKIFGVLRALRSEGLSILFLSQNYDQLLLLSDKILTLKNGSIEASVSQGEQPSYPYPKLQTATNTVYYECRHISYRNIIHDISFRVHKGEVLGFMGASGSGRSTLARLLCGDLPLTYGKTYLNGDPVRIRSAMDARARGIAYISEDSSCLVSGSDLIFNISLNNYRPSGKKRTPFLVNNRRLYQGALTAAHKFGIQGSLSLPVRYLSAGNQKKIAFARSVFAKAKLFVLDDPTRGIDAAGRLAIYNIINELAREGKGIILLTSDLNEAMGMCDRILILRGGMIRGEFSRDEFTETKISGKLYSNKPRADD